MDLGLHLITQSFGQDGHIVSILLGGVAVGTASRSLWLLVRIPAIKGDHRLDAIFQQHIRHPPAIVQTGLVEGTRFPAYFHADELTIGPWPAAHRLCCPRKKSDP